MSPNDQMNQTEDYDEYGRPVQVAEPEAGGWITEGVDIEEGDRPGAPEGDVAIEEYVVEGKLSPKARAGVQPMEPLQPTVALELKAFDSHKVRLAKHRARGAGAKLERIAAAVQMMCTTGAWQAAPS
eukprot:Clim_evm5s104 gene=Clim_evmTU5s104